jgi:hypothetical protein
VLLESSLLTDRNAPPPRPLQAESFDSTWVCSATTWNARFASCEAPQEQAGADGGPPSGPVGAAASVWVRSSSSLLLNKRHRNVLKSAVGAPTQKRGRKSNVERAAMAAAAAAVVSGTQDPDGLGGDLLEGLDGADGDSAGASGDSASEAGEGAAAAAAARRAGGRSALRPKREPHVLLAERWPPGTTEHIFWKGVEKTWDDMGITGNSRKLPILSGKLLDLFDLYGAMIDFGGYDVVRRRADGGVRISLRH